VLLGGGVDAEGSIRGATVNVAARMEQSAPSGRLRISHDSWRHVRGLFEFEEQPPISVKGVEQPMGSWLVVRALPRAQRGVPRGVDGVSTRMVGRDAELALLLPTLQRQRPQRMVRWATRLYCSRPLLRRPLDPDLVLGEHDEAAAPVFDLGGDSIDGCRQGLRPGLTQPKQQQTGMCAGGKPPGIRKVQILRDEESIFRVHSLPDFSIRPAAQLLVGYAMNIVAMAFQNGQQARGQVLVQLDLHATSGVACSGRSSSAETAAKATTARTASRLSVGKSNNSSSVSIPSARLASTVRTVTRVPVTTGSPPQIAGSRVM
jgi:hypothetical protein